LGSVACILQVTITVVPLTAAFDITFWDAIIFKALLEKLNSPINSERASEDVALSRIKVSAGSEQGTRFDDTYSVSFGVVFALNCWVFAALLGFLPNVAVLVIILIVSITAIATLAANAALNVFFVILEDHLVVSITFITSIAVAAVILIPVTLVAMSSVFAAAVLQSVISQNPN
jgi:hypothetical protein